MMSYSSRAVRAVAFIAGSLALAPSTAGASTQDQAAIRRTLASYNAALNSGKTEAVMPLYTTDGIFMAPFTESNVGLPAVRIAYDNVFKELTFSVKFTIRELVQLSPTYAFVRTNSAGTTRHASTGRTTSEANQELFLLRKSGGRWRIARYSFSPTSPPKG